MEFVPNNIYHVYNRGNNNQPIFFERENYLFFLKKIRNHLSPFVEILAYCLMPNHLLVLIPESDSGLDLKSNPEFVINQKINNAIGTILRSYTRAINKKFNRTGSLFQKGTKAKKMNNDQQSFVAFHYLHQNPIEADLVKNMQDWEFSSFSDYGGYRNGTLVNKQLAYDLLDISQESQAFIHQSLGVKIDDVR